MKKLFALIAVAALVAFAAPAFAANPFADVPMNHWAYDAVAQLAANGIVVGYPDGAYKGGQPATRYELAAVVARALANVDMNKASKQDLEMLKKLVVEFKSELDALGVKVDKLDARVAVLEERIGGWKFSGNFRFTAKWADDSTRGIIVNDTAIQNFYGVDQDSNWSVDRFRWNIVKYVDDKVTLNVRLQGGGGNSLDVARAYATIQFPWDVTANIGRFPLDWEGDFYATDFAGYMMNDAYVTDFDPLATAVWFKKPFEMGSFEMFVAHNEQLTPDGEGYYGSGNYTDYYQWGARLAFNFNENLSMAANYVKYDFASTYEDLGSFSTLWGDLIVNFNENIAFKGQYFVQDRDWYWQAYGSIDSPSAWKAILQINQDQLKFTDLWVEYAQLDEGFAFTKHADPYAWALGVTSPFLTEGGFCNYTYGDTTILNIVARQKWNDQWWTYVRYFSADSDYKDYSYKDYTASVRYNYTPNLWFELGYDKIEPDWNIGDFGDSMVWFRTTVNF